jgi:hypothetical protein
MKTFLILALAVFTCCRASSQVTVEIVLEQEQFLPCETMPLAVKITNQSGQPIHLGADPNWLTFTIESLDGFVVLKNAEVPVQGEFDLESSQMGIKRVDVAPYFTVNKTGRYKIIATMRIPDWAATVTSAPKAFDIIHGAKIWAQDFGVRTGTNAAPDVRKYTLEQANYLRSQLRLYVQLSDGEEHRIYHTEALGAMVSFSSPEAQIDRNSQLHVLWQAGAQAFTYCLVGPDGKLIRKETYDNFGSRPRMKLNALGEVVIIGGTRRGLVAEVPPVKAPAELPAPAATN